jgi:hypothetical protein
MLKVFIIPIETPVIIPGVIYKYALFAIVCDILNNI